MAIGGAAQTLRKLFMPALRLLLWAVVWCAMLRAAQAAAQAEAAANVVTALPDLLAEALRCGATDHEASWGIGVPLMGTSAMPPRPSGLPLRDQARWESISDASVAARAQQWHTTPAWLADRALGATWQAGLELLALRLR